MNNHGIRTGPPRSKLTVVTAPAVFFIFLLIAIMFAFFPPVDTASEAHNHGERRVLEREPMVIGALGSDRYLLGSFNVRPRGFCHLLGNCWKE